MKETDLEAVVIFLFYIVIDVHFYDKRFVFPSESFSKTDSDPKITFFF